MFIKKLPRQIIAFVLFVLAGGIALITPFKNLLDALGKLQLLDYILAILAMLLIFTGIAYLLQYFAYKDSVKKLVHVKDNDSNFDGIIYKHSQRDLEPLHEELERSKVVYALWHVGGQAQIHNIYHRKIVKRLLLIEPNLNFNEPLSGYIKKYWEGETPSETYDSVLRSEKLCKDNGGQVYFINKVPPLQITISNPDNIEAWAKIEEFNLNKSHRERRSIIIIKEIQPYFYNMIYDYFNKLWEENSRKKK
jgi:hypothetical protein